MKLHTNGTVRLSELVGKPLPSGDSMSGEMTLPLERIFQECRMGGLSESRALLYVRYYKEQRQRLDLSSVAALATTLALIAKESEQIQVVQEVNLLPQTCLICFEIYTLESPCKCERNRAAHLQDISDARAGLPPTPSPVRPLGRIQHLMRLLRYDLTHCGPLTIAAFIVLVMLLLGILSARGADLQMHFFFGGD